MQSRVLHLLLLLPGCSAWNHSGVPADQMRTPGAAALPVRYSASDSFIVENRYFVLPLRMESKSSLPKSFLSLSLPVGGECLDLEIIDLRTGEYCRVFGTPVVLQEWGLSFQPPSQETAYQSRTSRSAETVLRFPGMLVLAARSEDMNRDGKLDREDPLLLYGYDLAARELFRMSPPNSTLLKSQASGEQLILTLSEPDGQVSIYMYAPATRQGRFVVEKLCP